MTLNDYLADLPLIAILRGVRPDEIIDVGDALVAAGFRVIEIPLNSPEPLDSIERLATHLGESAVVGAGTVLSTDDVTSVGAVGGRLIVSPNMKPSVIEAAKAAGLFSAPGVATPTEGFAALDAGADALKLFPAEAITPAIVKAWRAVVPNHVPLMPVGGISPDTMQPYMTAGATGFGLGSALYKAGMDADTVRPVVTQIAGALLGGES